jgi:hypothetical protein
MTGHFASTTQPARCYSFGFSAIPHYEKLVSIKNQTAAETTLNSQSLFHVLKLTLSLASAITFLI